MELKQHEWNGLEWNGINPRGMRSEEHTSELQSRLHLVCRLLLEKKKCRCQRGPGSPCRGQCRAQPGACAAAPVHCADAGGTAGPGGYCSSRDSCFPRTRMLSIIL